MSLTFGRSNRKIAADKTQPGQVHALCMGESSAGEIRRGRNPGYVALVMTHTDVALVRNLTSPCVKALEEWAVRILDLKPLQHCRKEAGFRIWSQDADTHYPARERFYDRIR